jgi:uncharacterized Zn finger protein
MSREELVRLLDTAARPARGRAAAHEEPEPAAAAPEPLRPDVEGFWRGTERPVDALGDAQVPPTSAVLLRRLGPLPFWRGARSLAEALEPVYARASPRGLDLLARLSGAPGSRPEEERPRAR